MLNFFVVRFSNISYRLMPIFRSILTSSVQSTSYLPSYYRLNDLMWQDGLLIDFLQKKVLDKFIRRFLVCSSYLYSERVVFRFVVRFYVDYVVWPSTNFAIFETSSVSLMLKSTLLSLVFLLLIFHLNYVFILLSL